MHLKRLELFGFKTFAERIELEFAPGITAIVGPNGSGKSNLADAILWVFGEQSLKTLRSTRSQDVIFAGSQQKKPVGLAEVSLTLDNSSGRLGLDFSEVTVTRRVYRSGESEYLLNRVPCRMRDIHDLIMDTGIGRQAYSIINQQQIDAILSVRPEDRRELVEEVAGVGKYRQRKKEALRKLDATRANLLRVNDITGELEGQLEPLIRQAEQAKEYRQIMQELGGLRLSLLVADHDAFTNSLQKAKERESELEAAIEASRSRESQHAADEVTLRAQLVSVEEKLDETRSLTGRLGHEIDRQEGQEALTKEKIAASERHRQNLTSDRTQFEGNLQHAQEQEEQARSRQQQITAQEQETRSLLQTQEQELAQTDSEAAHREKALAEVRLSQLDLLGKTSEKKNAAAQGASLLRAAEARLARITEECTSVGAEVEALSTSEAEKSQEATQLAERIPQLRSQLEDLVQRRQAADTHVKECATAEAVLTKEHMATHSRLEALEALVKAHEGMAPEVRALAAQGFAPVSDLLQGGVSEKYAPAIEAALGLWLEALVCETQADVLRGRDFLREKGGKAHFVVLEKLSQAATVTMPKDASKAEGFEGLASDLIRFAEQHRPLFASLLGKTILMRDFDTALQVYGKLSGEWTLITLEGEILTTGGMALGKEKSSEGILRRQAEIDALREKLAGLEKDRAAAEAKLRTAREEFASLTEQATKTREQVNASESRHTSLKDNLRVLQEQIARGRRRLEGMELEAAGLDNEIAQSRTEQKVFAEELATLESQSQEMSSGLAEAERALRESRAARETKAQEVARLKVSLASLAGDRQAQEARIQSLVETQKSMTMQIGSREESLQALEGEQVKLSVNLEALKKSLEEVRAAHQKAKGELEAVSGERQRILEAIAAQLEVQKADREERETTQASLHRLQLRITQLDGELAFLQRNLEEDHRISLEKARELAQPIDSRKEAQERISTLQAQIDEIGTVNLGAMEEYERVKSRLDFLSSQREDLQKAREDLEKVIAEIDATAREKFLECFYAVQREFDDLFKRLFEGGETELRLVGEEEILESGLEVEVTIPGKKRQNLMLLSGGERALTAMALVFSLLRVKPTPFVVMDEIDAPLDDSNVGRFSALLRDFAKDSQFICITHNKSTMEAADTIYGVTMQKAGVSSLISMKLSELPAN